MLIQTNVTVKILSNAAPKIHSLATSAVNHSNLVKIKDVFEKMIHAALKVTTDISVMIYHHGMSAQTKVQSAETAAGLL